MMSRSTSHPRCAIRDGIFKSAASRITQQHPLAVLMAVGLVHAMIGTTVATSPARAGPPVETTPRTPTRPLSQPAVADKRATALPPAVADMREVILDAVHSGRLEDLQIALDLNELKPELAATPVPDPIAYWRSVSTDGQGRDVLAALGMLLELPYTTVPLGKDVENNKMYVWPAFADRPLATLTSEEAIDLRRLVPDAEAEHMTLAGRYTGWRVVIGADGVWHSFRRHD